MSYYKLEREVVGAFDNENLKLMACVTYAFRRVDHLDQEMVKHNANLFFDELKKRKLLYEVNIKVEDFLERLEREEKEQTNVR